MRYTTIRELIFQLFGLLCLVSVIGMILLSIIEHRLSILIIISLLVILLFIVTLFRTWTYWSRQCLGNI